MNNQIYKYQMEFLIISYSYIISMGNENFRTLLNYL